MSGQPSRSKSIIATPPLMDSTMYFCSGLERCSKRMPVEPVMSTSCGLGDGVESLVLCTTEGMAAGVCVGLPGPAGDCENNRLTAKRHSAPAQQITLFTRGAMPDNQFSKHTPGFATSDLHCACEQHTKRCVRR